jgi:glycosyltransferase involved in cell wall biosynthesis
MRILFLVPYPQDEAPSQRFRFEQYFDLLKEKNIDFNVSSFWSLRAWKILYLKGRSIEKIGWLLTGFFKRIIDLIRSIGYERIFIHRECAPIGPPIFEFILAKFLRKKIIYDFDDAIWLTNTSKENRLAAWAKFHGKVKYICRWSHIISCGNNWLADYAKQFNSNVRVNPTTIDLIRLHNPALHSSKSMNQKLVIGWTGTHSTIGYLQSIVPVLQSLEKKYPVVIRIISNKDPKLSLASIDFVPWKKENEIADLLTFDIGIMPLDDNEWANGKCGFKALQYMALGIPCIASPVGENNSIIQHGFSGILCRTENDWEEGLEKLIRDSALRNRMGQEGKRIVEKTYSVSSNSTNFFSLTKS